MKQTRQSAAKTTKPLNNTTIHRDYNEVQFLVLKIFYYNYTTIVRSFYRKLVRKMNSNRFISRLVDQNLICIIKISALTFMPSTGTFDLIFYNCDFLEF